jgi:hypothetical protein
MDDKRTQVWLTKHPKHRRLLKAGKVETVIDTIRSLGRGHHKKAIHTELNYFIKHKEHMTYDKLKLLEGKKRRGDHTASLLFLKADRWNTLKRIALAPKLEAIV